MHSVKDVAQMPLITDKLGALTQGMSSGKLVPMFVSSGAAPNHSDAPCYWRSERLASPSPRSLLRKPLGAMKSPFSLLSAKLAKPRVLIRCSFQPCHQLCWHPLDVLRYFHISLKLQVPELHRVPKLTLHHCQLQLKNHLLTGLYPEA